MKEDQFINDQVIDGVNFKVIGSLDNLNIVIFINRTDVTKPSKDIHRLLLRMFSAGKTVLWFDTENIVDGSQEINNLQMLNLLEVPTYISDRVAAIAHVLNRSLKNYKIYLVGYSAGGIIATMLACRANIEGVICFGYPFNAPGIPKEYYRIAHLAKLQKPVLIFQGIHDEYGNKEQLIDYDLSSSIRVVSINSGHNCDEFEEDTIELIWEQIQLFCKSTFVIIISGSV